MSEIIVTRGVPASGKSTWAESWVAEDPENRLRVNLDDLRMEMYGSFVLFAREGVIDKNKENAVYREAMKRVLNGVLGGKKVVYDATNLGMRNYNAFTEAKIEYKKLTGEELKLSVRDFPITYQEALERNSSRDRVVPEEVMKNMFRKLGPKGEFRHIDGTYEVRPFRKPSKRELAICFDMDGTLVDVRDVRYFVNGPKGSPRDFDSFHRFSLHSPANRLVVEELLEAHNRGYKIVITTAREEQYREITQKWLDDNNVPYDNIFMRKAKDYRVDYEVKKEMLHELVLPHYDVVRCVDDNPQAIKAWVENGLSVTVIPFVDDSNSSLYEGKEIPISEKLFREGVCVRCNRPISKGVIGPKCALIV